MTISHSSEGAHASRRIVIFGNAGAGKSTLAARMAKALGLEVLELDAVRWERRPDRPNSPATCRRLIEAFMAAHDGWIVEGLHATLLAVASQHASELHFLNPGFEVCRGHALSRPWDPRKSASPEEQQALFHQYEPFFRSYDTRTDETSLQAHRALFDAFEGTKHEHLTDAIEI